MSEAIQNRKTAVTRCLDHAIAETGNACQIISLGARCDPLSLALCDRYPHVVVFEVDREEMEGKALLLHAADATLAQRIRCMAADVADPTSLHSTLQQRGWSPTQSTVIVTEGLSYYLSEFALWNTLRAVRADVVTHYVLEYRRYPEEMDEPFRTVAEQSWLILQELFGVDTITNYRREVLQQHFAQLGGAVVEFLTLADGEQIRTGTNVHFPPGTRGWVEVCRARV